MHCCSPQWLYRLLCHSAIFREISQNGQKNKIKSTVFGGAAELMFLVAAAAQIVWAWLCILVVVAVAW
jgi:hypothetical protein